MLDWELGYLKIEIQCELWPHEIIYLLQVGLEIALCFSILWVMLK